jgi:hypothetical protein
LVIGESILTADSILLNSANAYIGLLLIIGVSRSAYQPVSSSLETSFANGKTAHAFGQPA